MNIKSCTGRALAGAILLFALPLSGAHAAVAVFLELEGIPGESTVDRLPGNTIEVLEWEWGLDRSPLDSTGTSRQRASGLSIRDLSFTSYNSRATPKLIEAITRGVIIPRGTLFLINPATGFVVEELELANIGITGVTTGVEAGSDRPVSTVTLTFTRFKYSYTVIGPDGSRQGRIETQYDIAQGN